MKMDSRIKNVNSIYSPYEIYCPNYSPYNICKDNSGKFGYFPKTHYDITDLNICDYGKFIGVDDDGMYRYVTKDGKVDSSMYYIPESNLK